MPTCFVFCFGCGFFACPYSLMLCSFSGAGTGLPSPPPPPLLTACFHCLFSTCTLRSSLALLPLKIFCHLPPPQTMEEENEAIYSDSLQKLPEAEEGGTGTGAHNKKCGKCCPHPNQGLRNESVFPALSKSEMTRLDVADRGFSLWSVLSVPYSGTQLWAAVDLHFLYLTWSSAGWCVGTSSSVPDLLWGFSSCNPAPSRTTRAGSTN